MLVSLLQGHSADSDVENEVYAFRHLWELVKKVHWKHFLTKLEQLSKIIWQEQDLTDGKLSRGLDRENQVSCLMDELLQLVNWLK